MRRIVSISVVLLATLFLALGAFAQQAATTNACVTVVERDNLWTFDHNFDLTVLARQNPELKPALDASARQFTTKYNQPGIRIFPDECLYGVTRQGQNLVPTPAVNTTQAGITTGPATPNQQASQPTSKTAETVGWSLLALIALVVAALALIAWLLRRRDPAGLPERRFAPEGVQPEQAHAHATTLAPQVQPGRPFVILSQTRQRARGAVISEYVRPARRETVVLDGGPSSYVYQTRLRFTDTNEEAEMPFLQACGNPIRFGTIARWIPGLGFEYLGEPEVVPEPVAFIPEPVAEPEPAPVPAVVAERRPVALTGIELPIDGDTPSFRMTRMTDQTVVMELAASSGAQFMLTVPAASVYYAAGNFTFDASGLPPGIKVPVPAEVIAAAAVRQLTAPPEPADVALPAAPPNLEGDVIVAEVSKTA